MAKDLAIVLNNGSINSAVVTALAAQKYRPVLLFAETSAAAGAPPVPAGVGAAGTSAPVGVGASRLRVAYDQQVAHFKPYREHTLAMPFLSVLAPAGATGSAPPPAAIDPRHPSTIAPQMLEMLPLLAAAVRFAVFYGAAAVYAGLRVGPGGDELATATEYTQVWNELIQMPCGQPDMTLEAPLLELEPWQVVDVGFQVNAPFDRTWSCVEQLNEPCWACRGCRAREQAFQQAAKPDPMRVVRKV